MDSSSATDPPDLPAAAAIDELASCYHAAPDDEAKVAWAELLRVHDRVLRADALRLCGGHHADADDLLQDFTMHLFAVRKRFLPEKGVWLHWARKVLSRCASGFRRKTTTRSHHVTFDEQALDVANSPDQPEWLRLWADEVRQAASDCLDKLDQQAGSNGFKMKATFLLRVFKGTQVQAICDLLDLGSTATVTRYVENVTRRLRDCMQGKGFGTGEE
ncbi:MAG: sigma-70 family RNA polymerase sigma factor [Pirellulales bacterium]